MARLVFIWWFGLGLHSFLDAFGFAILFICLSDERAQRDVSQSDEAAA
jgi:hypothetical protein